MLDLPHQICSFYCPPHLTSEQLCYSACWSQNTYKPPSLISYSHRFLSNLPGNPVDSTFKVYPEFIYFLPLSLRLFWYRLPSSSLWELILNSAARVIHGNVSHALCSKHSSGSPFLSWQKPNIFTVIYKDLWSGPHYLWAHLLLLSPVTT